jgi:isochorismate synthase
VQAHNAHHRQAVTEDSLIDRLLDQDTTFAAFRLPGQEVQLYLQRDKELRSPHSGQRCFVLAPFDAAEGPALCIRPDEVRVLGAIPPVERPEAEPRLRTAAHRGLDRGGFASAVDRALQAIRKGEVEKVVLARTTDADLDGLSIGALFHAATRELPDAFVAIARTARYGLWLGASPERLLTMRNEHVEVDALAGTMAADLAPDQAMEWGLKEREEQAIVTRRIMEWLRSAGVVDGASGMPSTKRAGPVAHLRTIVRGRMNDPDPVRLASALHPTPAVGGSPADAALDLIKRLEPRGRSLYAGYWGPMSPTGADFFVNIRCMEIHGHQALLHVGAGITRDSVAESECDEVERKARTWLDLIDAQRAAG